MKEETKSNIWRIAAGLFKVAIFLGLVGGFWVHGKHLAEFQNRCWSMHGWMNAVFKEKQAEAYKIVTHLRVEYPLMTINEKWEDFPQGEIAKVDFHDQYPIMPSSQGTYFIYDLLVDIVDNEASLFQARFKRLPTIAEMENLLEKIPYYGYLHNLQLALYELEWQTNRFAHPNNLSSLKIEELDQFKDYFIEDQEAVEQILAKDPSKLKFIRVHLVQPAQDI